MRDEPEDEVLDVAVNAATVVRGLVRRRKSAAVELFDLALEDVRLMAVTSPLLRDVDKVPDDCKHNPLVEAALEAGVETIVSDDNDLLSSKVIKVRGFRPVHIYAPGPFLKSLPG